MSGSRRTRMVERSCERRRVPNSGARVHRERRVCADHWRRAWWERTTAAPAWRVGGIEGSRAGGVETLRKAGRTRGEHPAAARRLHGQTHPSARPTRTKSHPKKWIFRGANFGAAARGAGGRDGGASSHGSMGVRAHRERPVEREAGGWRTEGKSGCGRRGTRVAGLILWEHVRQRGVRRMQASHSPKSRTSWSCGLKEARRTESNWQPTAERADRRLGCEVGWHWFHSTETLN